jgi:hypothetical protein
MHPQRNMSTAADPIVTWPVLIGTGFPLLTWTGKSGAQKPGQRQKQSHEDDLI